MAVGAGGGHTHAHVGLLLCCIARGSWSHVSRPKTCGSTLLQKSTAVEAATSLGDDVPDITELFAPLAQGSGWACRGSTSADNRAEYYELHAGATLSQCMALCVEEPRCQGIEHSAPQGRCEVWIRPEGIGAVAAVPGYQCFGYTQATTTERPVLPWQFEPVDGGEGRACRGASSLDNDPSYYIVFNGIASLEACSAQCLLAASCRGIEYSSSGRCEVWTRAQGIAASQSVRGYRCFRYIPETSSTTATGQTPSTSSSSQSTASPTTTAPTTTASATEPRTCSAGQVQRRRRVEAMCSCRRRSGKEDLASGWECVGSSIVSTSDPTGATGSTSTTTAGATQPPAVSNGCVELLVVGDYGTRDGNQRRVAAGLAAVASEVQPAAIAGIGDNIYGSGAEEDPQLIVDWWRNVYLPHESLKRPWYVVTGNHDWYTDARTERDFTTHPENTGGWWKMPHFWYKRSFQGNSGVVVDAFFIDTQVWKGSSVVEAALGGKAKQQQIAWLTAELNQSVADWKLVLGHHPVYSAGSHGITNDLLEDLDPLMRRFGVQVLFSGHDHSKQLMQHRGLNYVISGAGGATSRSRSNEYPVGSQKHIFEDHGFVGLSICSAAAATLSFFSADGRLQAEETLPSTWPEASLEPGRPALANGDAAVRQPLCGNVLLRDVDLVCPAPDGSGCKVLADQMTGKTCREYCSRNGLQCKGGWEEEDENCVPTHELGCDQAYGSTSDLICECMP
eukprot:gb/GFBE01057881.1/.p1 GENE.gb/GFBE01057881.1/~~gb/GFBE01057881.1/.p1  ORF type:complete len:733 (+),score=124.17 gb/GFBE01057881.1/:1-2199(+)